MNFFSWQHAIREDVTLSSNAKFVGMTLSTYMSADGGSCFPSQERLAKNCSISSRSVVRAINELVKTEYLIKYTLKGKGQGWKRNQYKACFPKKGSDTESPPLSKGSDTQSPMYVTQSHTNKPVDQSSKNIYLMPPAGVDENTWIEYLEIRKKKKAVNSETALKMLHKNINQIVQLKLSTAQHAVETAIEHSWKTLKPEYMRNQHGRHKNTRRSGDGGHRPKTGADILAEDLERITGKSAGYG